MPLQLVSWKFKNGNKNQDKKVEMQLNHNISIPKDSKEVTFRDRLPDQFRPRLMGPENSKVPGIAQNAHLAKSATSVTG